MVRPGTPVVQYGARIAFELGDVDLAFRPRSYFWPLCLETHLLSRIKGAERKAALQRVIDAGRLEDIPNLLIQSTLSEPERQSLGRIHPAFMGGEYLPDLLATEVMVARIVRSRLQPQVDRRRQRYLKPGKESRCSIEQWPAAAGAESSPRPAGGCSAMIGSRLRHEVLPGVAGTPASHGRPPGCGEAGW